MDHSNTIDDMPNITRNFTDDVYDHPETPYEKIFLEVFTLVGLLSLLSNCLLIFVILKYKKMREDATNLIFLHVNVLQAFYLAACPLTLRIGMAFFHLSPVHEAVFCVSYQILNTVMFVIAWFILLMVCDWYLKLYYKDKYVTFCRVYTFFIIALYVFTILVCSVTIQFCFRFWMVFLVYFAMFIFVVLLLVFLIIMNVVHAIRKRKLLSPKRGNMGLAVANITLFVWSPAVLFILLTFVIYVDAPLTLIFLCCLGFSSPVFNLLYLYYYDNNYNVFLKKVFKCTCNDYQNESLEDPSVTYSDVNGVHISDK